MSFPACLRVPFGLTFGLCLVLVYDKAGAQTVPAPPATAPASVAPRVNPEDRAEPADLTTDARLDRKVSLHEIGVPLSSLLLKVSQGDLALSAGRNCDALELHLNLVNRPLRQLMTALAQLVPGQWYHTPDGKGYALSMNRKAVVRRDRWWDLTLAEQQRIVQNVPRMALKAMGGKPTLPAEAHSADGNDEGFHQFLLAGPSFFNQIPVALQARIAGSLNEITLFAGIRGTGINEGALMVPLADLPDEAQKRLTQRVNLSERAKQDNGYVRFTNDGSGLSAELVDTAGDSLGASFSMDVPIEAEQASLWKVKRMERLHQDVPPVWKELADYEESRIWPNASPSKGYYPFNDRITDLEKMAEEDHLEFVSDYYSRPISRGFGPTPRLTAQEKEEVNKLENRLNALAANADLSWKPTRDKIYLLRNNRWYYNDRVEVPMPLLQRWLEQDARQWAKSPLPNQMEGEALRRMLDWQAEVVSTLTPWQIFHGLQWATVPTEKRKDYASETERNLPGTANDRFAPFRMVTFSFVGHYHLMQFYATLSKEQRTALLASGLNFYTLTADQQQQATYLQPLLAVYVHESRPVGLILRHLHGGGIGGDTHVGLQPVSP